MTPANKGQVYPSWPLEREEMRAILDAANVRDRAALVLMARGGARCAEALDVQFPGEVRFHQDGTATVQIARPKGWDHVDPRKRTRPRGLGLDKLAAELVKLWVARRGSDPGPLIWTEQRRAADPSHYRRLLPRLAMRAGIERRVHPHCLRHSFAKHAWEDGVDLVLISRALGHKDLRTTDRYLQDIGCHQAADVLKRREW